MIFWSHFYVFLTSCSTWVLMLIISILFKLLWRITVEIKLITRFCERGGAYKYRYLADSQRFLLWVGRPALRIIYHTSIDGTFCACRDHVVDYFLRGFSREQRRGDVTNSPEIPVAFPIRNGLATMHGGVKCTAVVYCTYWEIDSLPPPPNVASMRTKELSATEIPHGFSRYYTSHVCRI